MKEGRKGTKHLKKNREKDTFDLSDWWKSNCGTLSGFTYVLCAVLTNSPNSYPTERFFSLFNTTYDDDQKRSHTDYIELSIQSQFNKRPRPVVVQCLDRGGRGGMVEGVGVWYLYEIALCLHVGNMLRHTFRNH